MFLDFKNQNHQLNESMNQINLEQKKSGEDYFKEGMLLFDSSKFRASIEYFDKAIEFKYDLEKSYLKKGTSLFWIKYYAEAILCADKSLEINPSCIKAFQLKGFCLEMTGKLEEAKYLFKKTIEIPCNTNNSEELLDKSKNLLKVGEYAQALQLIDKSIAIKPNDVAFKIKGDILGEMNMETESIDWYNKALNLNENYLSAYWSKGSRQKKVKKFKDAIESFTKAIQLHPTSTIYRLIAEAYVELKENENAVQSYINAIALDPKDKQSLDAMNELLEMQ